jgi:hypothetical protein
VSGNRDGLRRYAGAVLRPASVVIVAVAVATLLGCGEKKTETTPEQELPPFLVKLDRSDGFSFDEHLVVKDFRRASVRFRYRPNDQRGTRRFTLSEAQSDRLTGALTRARNFAGLRSRYGTSEGSEAVTHSVTYRGRTIVVDETALKQGKVPQRLTRVLSLLNRLLDSKVPTPQNRAP